jgi:hypothetical protein
MSITPVPIHLQEGPSNAPKLKVKRALEHEAKEALSKQRKARIGLKLYDTLEAEELSGLFSALNNFDIRQELRAQEHDTIAQAQELAKNDTKWEIETQTRHSESDEDQVDAAVGKQLSKVYRFGSWTMATKHFWRRLNECFEQQDVRAFQIRFLLVKLMRVFIASCRGHCSVQS